MNSFFFGGIVVSCCALSLMGARKRNRECQIRAHKRTLQQFMLQGDKCVEISRQFISLGFPSLRQGIHWKHMQVFTRFLYEPKLENNLVWLEQHFPGTTMVLGGEKIFEVSKVSEVAVTRVQCRAVIWLFVVSVQMDAEKYQQVRPTFDAVTAHLFPTDILSELAVTKEEDGRLWCRWGEALRCIQVYRSVNLAPESQRPRVANDGHLQMVHCVCNFVLVCLQFVTAEMTFVLCIIVL